jgi:hypothetical protein
VAVRRNHLVNAKSFMVILAAVLAFYRAMFNLSDSLHRHARRRVRNFDSLRTKSHGIVKEIPTAHEPAESIRRIEATFAQRNPTVTWRNDTEIVLFAGEGGGSLQFSGILYATANQMPILVAAQARNGCVKLIVDNDFGWNVFVGPARTKYLSLVREAIAAAHETARRAVS